MSKTEKLTPVVSLVKFHHLRARAGWLVQCQLKRLGAVG